MQKSYRVAIVGATGAVGLKFIECIERRKFPCSEVVLYASPKSEGKVHHVNGKPCRVVGLTPDRVEKFDFAFFSAGSGISKEYAPLFAKKGAVVVDNSSAWRMDPGTPLVVPEVNPADIWKHKGIIANPNCSTIQMVVALKPIHDAAKIKRVVVSTYQSTSGAGKEAMDELLNQTKSFFVNQDLEPKKFTKNIAFNVIPHIDVFMDDGSTKEEWKMVVETRKILDPDIAVQATCVRVPVFISHAEAVTVEFENAISVERARAALKAAPGVTVIDHHVDEGYVTPQECAGEDSVFVSRIRKDPTVKHGLSIWVVADNLRKGAALNAVQIAELLDRDYLEPAEKKRLGAP